MSYAKAKKILGWTPKVTFEEGVKRTIASTR
jgi:nucleoside-diphosphate-sugar epimerase